MPPDGAGRAQPEPHVIAAFFWVVSGFIYNGETAGTPTPTPPSSSAADAGDEGGCGRAGRAEGRRRRRQPS